MLMGAAVARWLVCTMHSRFYGFSCAQTQYYFHEYPTDKVHLKILVRLVKIRFCDKLILACR